MEEKKEGEDFNEWEYLYGAFELFTENRKRNQIIMIENVIFKIKDTFNNEFEKMMSQRQN